MANNYCVLGEKDEIEATLYLKNCSMLNYLFNIGAYSEMMNFIHFLEQKYDFNINIILSKNFIVPRSYYDYYSAVSEVLWHVGYRLLINKFQKTFFANIINN